MKWVFKMLCSFFVTANTTRIFQGSRIVKTGMVSWPEDGTANFFFHVSGIHVVLLGNHIFSACLPQPTMSPASPADMAPISSGSSTWTSSGIHFSIVSIATGMGPSSSGSQATVASVVTSTLLAGLGVGGGVISSLPSSVWPTQAPQATRNPTRPFAQPAKSSTEQAPPQGSDMSEENQAAQGGEDEEKEGEREGEQEEEEDEKKRKNKTPDNEEVQGNSTVAKKPLIPTPASTAKEKGEGRPTVKDITIPASTGDQQLVNIEEKPTDVNGVSTQMPRNDSAEMQIPQSSTLSPKISSLWPFSVHTGERTSFFQR